MRNRFMFKSINSTNYIQRGVGHLSMINYKFFCNQFCSFLDKVNTQISENFEQFFISKIEFLQFLKISFNCNGHKVYLTVGKLHCLLKH